MNREIIFAFIGGTVLGAFGAVIAMKKAGYVKVSQEEINFEKKETEGEKLFKSMDTEKVPLIWKHGEVDPSVTQDKPSFKMKKELDTHKVRYDTLKEKPELEEMAKKYTEEDLEEDEEESNGSNPELGDVEVYDDDDLEYGHIIKQLPARRKDQLIYLVPQDYAGELYLLEDLIYYETDDVLADVTDAPVIDYLGVIGDGLGYFGQYGADEDKLFIRNCTAGIEYEITRVHGRYADKLYGVDTSKVGEESQKQRKIKRRKEDSEIVGTL